MKSWWFFSMLALVSYSHADTINNYMSIADNIPQMEMKADAQSQAWARSAHHVLTITAESIAETLNQTNEVAKSQGRPIFCLPQGGQLSSANLNEIILQTYKGLTSADGDKEKMTVSQVALLGVTKQYPCQATKEMAHLANILTH
jgi:hypothetical protein